MPSPTELLPVEDTANWTGDQIKSGHNWLYHLSDDEVAALLDMATRLRHRLNNNPDTLKQLSREHFDLGQCQSLIDRVYRGLKSGLGLALIRGLPIRTLDAIDIATIYWGIGLHLGDAVSNNPEGDLIGHVTDLGKTQTDPNSRGYQTRETMDYHCDQCDIVGLMCIRTAQSGGTSYVASSVSMYNTLLNQFPQYAAALTAPLYWTKHGEFSDGETPFYTSPVFNFLDGRLCTSFGPKHIIKGHALAETPDLSEIQRKAIDMAETIAADQRIEMDLNPGDMQFVNNYVILHTRSAYQDFDTPEEKRLLWRLWLMNSSMRSRTDYSLQWLKGVRTGPSNTRIRLE